MVSPPTPSANFDSAKLIVLKGELKVPGFVFLPEGET